MIGRTPANISAIRPMRDGVIADYVITEALLRHFIGRVQQGRRFGFGKPIVMISVPAGVTSVEKRAVSDAAVKAGAEKAYLIDEPVAAAIGAAMPISGPSGAMIIDIGGGTSEVAVMSLGAIVCSTSLRVGGNKIDEAIASYVRKKYNLMIGDRTAEEVKIAIGTALPLERELTMDVRGRDLIAGLPRTIPMTSSEVMEAMEPPLQQIIGAIRLVLEQTPPELASDIIDKGMVMSGGGSLLRNIDKLLTQVTGVPATSPTTRSTVSLGAPVWPSSTSTSTSATSGRRVDGGPGRAGGLERPAGVRRPALPHQHQLRLAGQSRRRRPGRRGARPDPPGRDRPRPNRRRPARPRRRPARADRHRRRGDQDRRRRRAGHLPRPRDSRPGSRPWRRSRRSGSRVAWSASRTPSTACAASAARAGRRSRRSPAGSTGSRPTTPGSSAATPTSGPPNSPVSRPAGPVRLGLAHRHGSGRRLQHRRRRSGNPGRGMLASLAGVELVPGRATFYVRAWTPIAKMIQTMRGNGRRRAPDSTGVSR